MLRAKAAASKATTVIVHVLSEWQLRPGKRGPKLAHIEDGAPDLLIGLSP